MNTKAGKHTPGPWHVHLGGNFAWVGAEGYDEYVRKESYLGGPFAVADVNWHASFDHSSNEKLALANARLIAAAPELLQALKTAVDNDGDLFDRELAIAAIAKAEGK